MVVVFLISQHLLDKVNTGIVENEGEIMVLPDHFHGLSLQDAVVVHFLYLQLATRISHVHPGRNGGCFSLSIDDVVGLQRGQSTFRRVFFPTNIRVVGNDSRTEKG